MNIRALLRLYGFRAYTLLASKVVFAHHSDSGTLGLIGIFGHKNALSSDEHMVDKAIIMPTLN